MSIASAQPKYSFGLRGDVSNNVWYLDEQNIIYPSGSNLIIFNIDQKTQKFIPCSLTSEGMTALAVSPNKRYAAISEKKADRPTVTVYDLTTLKKRKVLTPPETNSREIISIAFSPDSKYLITQLCGPDWLLGYWHWEKAKILAMTKSNGATNYHVKQVIYYM